MVRLSISTCVMLICPQCAALASDMEQHLTSHQVSTFTVHYSEVRSGVQKRLCGDVEVALALIFGYSVQCTGGLASVLRIRIRAFF